MVDGHELADQAWAVRAPWRLAEAAGRGGQPLWAMVEQVLGELSSVKPRRATRRIRLLISEQALASNELVATLAELTGRERDSVYDELRDAAETVIATTAKVEDDR